MTGNVLANDTGTANAYYEPNSFNGPSQDPRYLEPPLKVSGEAKRWDHREGNEDFAQPRALFELFDEAQKERLFLNIAEAMYGIPQFIIDRQLGHFDTVSAAYGAGVRRAHAAIDARHGADATMQTVKKVDQMAIHQTDAASLPAQDAAE